MPQRRTTVAQQSPSRSRTLQPRPNEAEQFRSEVQGLAVQIAEAVIRREVAAGLSKAAERMARQLAAPIQRTPERTSKARSTRAPKKHKLAKPTKIAPQKGKATKLERKASKELRKSRSATKP